MLQNLIENIITDYESKTYGIQIIQMQCHETAHKQKMNECVCVHVMTNNVFCNSGYTVITLSNTSHLNSQDNHRLNGSSSPVLTATPHSYGKGQNSTPYKIKTPQRIGMKFGIVDYVLEISPQNKFGDDRISGGFWVNM